MTKVISISDEAYEELKRLKNGISFTKVIIELTNTKKKGSIIKYAGVLTKEEGNAILDEIRKERKKISRRML